MNSEQARQWRRVGNMAQYLNSFLRGEFGHHRFFEERKNPEIPEIIIGERDSPSLAADAVTPPITGVRNDEFPEEVSQYDEKQKEEEIEALEEEIEEDEFEEEESDSPTVREQKKELKEAREELKKIKKQLEEEEAEQFAEAEQNIEAEQPDEEDEPAEEEEERSSEDDVLAYINGTMFERGHHPSEKCKKELEKMGIFLIGKKRKRDDDEDEENK